MHIYSLIVSTEGQLGICMDAYSGEPEDRSRFGSQLYFLRHLMDLLYTEWSKTQLTDIKAAFESQDLLDGVIFEGYCKGNAKICK